MADLAPAHVDNPIVVAFNPAPTVTSGIPDEPRGTPPERAVDVAALIPKQIG